MKRFLVVLVLALAVLTSGCVGTTPASSYPAEEYVPQQLEMMKTVQGEARVSAYPVDFIGNEAVMIGDIEVAAGVGPGSVALCTRESAYCDPGYLFGDGFDIGIRSVTSLGNQTGRIRIHSANGKYHLGFKAEEAEE